MDFMDVLVSTRSSGLSDYRRSQAESSSSRSSPSSRIMELGPFLNEVSKELLMDGLFSTLTVPFLILFIKDLFSVKILFFEQETELEQNSH